MFSFGLLASHTPYIIMAGLYLFYMLVNLGVKLNQTAEENAEEVQPAKTISCEIIPESEFETPVFEITAQDFQLNNFDDAVLATEKVVMPQRFLIFKRYLFSEQMLHRLHTCNLFVRPPPALV